MTQPGKIKLLIADDHPVARSGIKGLLAGTEIKVVAEVASGQAAVKYVLEHDVDVVLMDVRMPDGDGLTALGRIKLDKPNLPIVMFSAFDNPAYVARAVALGASGFLLKGCTRDELVNAITKAATGENRLHPRRTSPRDRGHGNATPHGRHRSPFDPTRGRSAAANGQGADEQGHRQDAAHQLRNGQGARTAHPSQDWPDRPDAGSRVGRA